jgi:hypothetical protein
MRDGSKPGKWEHVSDAEKEAFFEAEGVKIDIEGGAWYMTRANGNKTTLGNPEDRRNAIWIAYDLLKDPPPNRVKIVKTNELPEGYYYEEITDLDNPDDDDRYALYKRHEPGEIELIWTGFDYLLMFDLARDHEKATKLGEQMFEGSLGEQFEGPDPDAWKR